MTKGVVIHEPQGRRKSGRNKPPTYIYLHKAGRTITFDGLEDLKRYARLNRWVEK